MIAASHVTRAGNKVELDANGGVITNLATGRKIKLQRKGGVYILRMWVVPGKEVPAGFQRPGKA